MKSFNFISIFLLLLSSLVKAYSSPPACVLACVSQQVRNSGQYTFNQQASICSNLGNAIISCFSSTCPNNGASAATSYFKSLCGNNLGGNSTNSSSSISSTSTTSSATSSTMISSKYSSTVMIYGNETSNEYSKTTLSNENTSAATSTGSFEVQTTKATEDVSSSQYDTATTSKYETTSSIHTNIAMQLGEASLVTLILGFFFSLL
ncbi:hypothetical protein DASC09_045500 [Saccharomycopsis crataegensis]|mgnify:CR=1 FL=1|uniref:CFEM domain-containing protein n=1 Tax=Saccharomycopsis crataegensis TaxID=43959 RepID=A0AAV5QQL1_9ASCO|nr:hypothetical protein DASC09_045500 [Saccharomycopsis crataegensis]